MPTLAELQRDWRAALLGGDAAPAAASVAADGLRPEARLAIYRHHVTTSLTAVLQEAYPVVCRLVDPRFFRYAADAYIRREPPAEPRLSTYGEGFADFLAAFPSCRELPYLPDVARLEWALHVAYHAPGAEAPDPAALAARLAAVPAEDAGRARFRYDPSARYLASPYPVDHIWRANQAGAEGDAPVRLDAGAAHLEIRRAGDDATFRRLPPGEWTLRAELAAGRALDEAGAAALAAERELDLAGAIAALLSDRIVLAFTPTPLTEETIPC